MFRILSASGVALLIVSGLLAQDLDHGVALYQKKQYSEAASELQKVVDQNRNNVKARYYLGLSLLQLKQYKQAEEQFKAAGDKATAETVPGKDQVLVGLGRAFLDQKDYTAARSNLEAAAKLNPDNKEVFIYLGKLELEKRNFSAAAGHLEKAIALSPREPYPHYYAGIAYSNLRRPDKMVDEFRTFLKLAPDAPEAAQVRSLLRAVR